MCVEGAIGFVFASHWLKNWHEILKPITKHSNHNHVATFDSHFKTALCLNMFYVDGKKVLPSLNHRPTCQIMWHLMALLALSKSLGCSRCHLLNKNY